MTTDGRDTPSPSVAELAELDAGLVGGVEVDDATAARLRAEAATEPRSAAILAGLAATSAELAAVPPVPVPPGAVDRWAAMFDEEPPESLPTAADAPILLHRPRRPWLTRPAVAAAAVLVALAAAVGISQAVRAGGAPTVSDVELVAVARAAVGVRDAGGLDDPARRAGCLAAAVPQVTRSAPLVGARRVTFDGRSGVLLVLGTGTLGTFAVAVVDPACGPEGGTLLAFRTVP